MSLVIGRTPRISVAPLWATPSVPPVPCTQASCGAVDLARAALAAQLLGRLDDEEDAAHAGVVRRQPAAVEVHRQRAAEADAAAGDERAALADLAEARGSRAWPAR